jgi:DNA-binding GntR family transcriptional regulator
VLLVELKSLGILDVKLNRGATVQRFSVVKLREIYEVRRLMEVEATRKSSGRIDSQALDDLLKETQQMLDLNREDNDWELDQRIHATIADSCGNRRLTHEIERYATLLQAIRRTAGRRTTVHQVTTQQHLEILTALAKGEADTAGAAMHRHIRQAEESAVAAISGNLPESSEIAVIEGEC